VRPPCRREQLVSERTRSRFQPLWAPPGGHRGYEKQSALYRKPKEGPQRYEGVWRAVEGEREAVSTLIRFWVVIFTQRRRAHSGKEMPVEEALGSIAVAARLFCSTYHEEQGEGIPKVIVGGSGLIPSWSAAGCPVPYHALGRVRRQDIGNGGRLRGFHRGRRSFDPAGADATGEAGELGIEVRDLSCFRVFEVAKHYVSEQQTRHQVLPLVQHSFTEPARSRFNGGHLC